MEYIFFTGAPGSKWSGISKSVYWSPDINHTDYLKGEREYFRYPDDKFPAHYGAYWDEGMEFDVGDWDLPFQSNSEGIKLIKSHTIATKLETVKLFNPSSPIVMIWRDTQSCFDWWCEAGGFDISYPNYKPFYRNLSRMKAQTELQNKGILDFVANNDVIELDNILEINKVLDIKPSPEFNPTYPSELLHNTNSEWIGTDVRIFVYKPT